MNRPPFDLRPPPNPRYEDGAQPDYYIDPNDPAAWGLPGGVWTNVDGSVGGHGGGGHGGGGHGGHGHGGGWGWGGGWPVYDYGTPWPYYDEPDPNDPRWRKRYVTGQTSTGFGALGVIALIWLAYEAANKRVSR